MQQLIIICRQKKKKDKAFTYIVFNLLSMVKLETELPRGFRLFSMGMHLSQVKASLCLQSWHHNKVQCFSLLFPYSYNGLHVCKLFTCIVLFDTNNISEKSSLPLSSFTMKTKLSHRELLWLPKIARLLKLREIQILKVIFLNTLFFACLSN